MSTEKQFDRQAPYRICLIDVPTGEHFIGKIHGKILFLGEQVLFSVDLLVQFKECEDGGHGKTMVQMFRNVERREQIKRPVENGAIGTTFTFETVDGSMLTFSRRAEDEEAFDLLVQHGAASA